MLRNNVYKTSLIIAYFNLNVLLITSSHAHNHMYVNHSQTPSHSVTMCALRRLRWVELCAIIYQTGGHINMMLMCLAHSSISLIYIYYRFIVRATSVGINILNIP